MKPTLLDEIKSLFTQTAQAAVSIQEELDLHHTAAAYYDDYRKAVYPFYSVPRIAVQMDFGLKEDQTQGIMLLPFRRKKERRQLHEHYLNFSLIAVSEPPPLLPREIAGGTVLPSTIGLIQPHFLVAPAQQAKLMAQLIEDLRNGNWDFDLPQGETRPDEDKVEKEAKRIEDAVKNPKEQPDRGMIALRLDTQSPSYLLVRVTDKTKKDGLFVFRPDLKPQVMIYSFDNDGVENIVYEPLHIMALTVRNWLKGTPPVRVEYEPLDLTDSSPKLGLISLRDFAAKMAEGFIGGLKLLSEYAAPLADPAMPSYFDLADVRAGLSYSVYFNKDTKSMEFSFGPRMSPDGKESDTEIGVIESRASVRAFRLNDHPRIDVELIAPEFVLSGNAFRIFMIAAEKSAEDIARKFNSSNPNFYLQYLRGDVYKSGVVVFLSYKGNVPEQKFLVNWPGMWRGRPRDFVFFCELEGDKIEEIKLVNISTIMSLEEDLEEVEINLPFSEEEISQDKYTPFHNFFHAVRIWNSRIQL